jgi:predicted RecB family nuclease
MRIAHGRLIVTPTDLANFLTCRHKTALDLRVATGALAKPVWVDPFADVLQQRGRDHEARYVAALRDAGLGIVDFGATPPASGALPFEERLDRTRQAMAQGIDVIVQGALGNSEWAGYPDVLRRTDDGGYEAVDTKLSRETRGGTMLQLCVYTDLLREIQGRAPGEFHVVTPVAHERYRFDDYGAYFRAIKERLLDFLRNERVPAEAGGPDDPTDTYPDPVEHCEVCRWWAHCNRRRRRDDHLSFVHGLGRHHLKELGGRGIATLAALAAEPVPLAWKPLRGSVDVFVRMREQARLQVEQRDRREPVFECLPVDPGFGLCALPEPNPGDLFLDLEGDPFGRPHAGPAAGEGQREYLFGLARVLEDGSLLYRARWAFSDETERQAFDETMGEIMATIDTEPGARIYHYNHYEVTAFKRLAGRYAMREADLDRLLRGKRFVDLYAIVRRGVRAGVESYSLKDLEPFYQFAREVELQQAGDQRRLIEVALETGDLQLVSPSVRAIVETYNKDDVRSTAELRAWLESVRAALIAEGQDVPRPSAVEDQPSARVDERAQRAAAIRARLLEGVPPDRPARSSNEQARYLLAYLVDFHRRGTRPYGGITSAVASFRKPI